MANIALNFYKVTFLLTTTAVLLSVGYLSLRPKKMAAHDLPVYGSVADFELLNQNGEVVTDRDLKGSVQIVNFIFTSCVGVCPLLTKQMAKLEERTRGLGSRVKFVSISVDPAVDKPDRLKVYGDNYRANFQRWSFLTGPSEVIRRVVVEGFKTALDGKPVPKNDKGALMDITHGETFVILDQAGNIRAFKHATTETDLSAITQIVTELAKI